MRTRTVKAVELKAGHRVLADGDPLGFTVHAVDQAQGKVQVTDETGGTYTFTPDETLQIG